MLPHLPYAIATANDIQKLGNERMFKIAIMACRREAMLSALLV